MNRAVEADIESVNKKIDRVAKLTKSGDKKAKIDLEFLQRVKSHLEEGKPVRTIEMTEEEKEVLEDIFLLTIKPVIYIANLSEAQISNIENDVYVNKVKQFAKTEGAEVIALCAKLEEDLSVLEDNDRFELMEEYNIKESGLDQLIKKSYSMLGLISFLTCGKDETRAWTITEGTKAPAAAGKIHTDFERGFIKAEVVSFEDLKKYGSMNALKEKGLVRLEGKEYVVKDGDIILFRFNV